MPVHRAGLDQGVLVVLPLRLERRLVPGSVLFDRTLLRVGLLGLGDQGFERFFDP